MGVVSIFGENQQAIEIARAKIRNIVAVPEVGDIYHGKVKSIVAFGAFIEILPGKDGLCHISELDWKRVEKVEDILKEGDEIDVQLIDVDKKTGKLKLSRRALMPRPEGNDRPKQDSKAE